MQPLPIPSAPILSVEASRALETRLLGSDEGAHWDALTRAGRAVAAAVLKDFEEVGGFPSSGRILVLAGKGMNAGDALVAAASILKRHADASVDVAFVDGPRALVPLSARAWRDLVDGASARVRAVEAPAFSGSYDLCIGALYGAGFRPPLPPEARALIAAARRCRVRLNAAVDLPSGLGEDGAFEADFTYATGSVKAPLLGCAHAGRLRYLDLGFLDDAESAPPRAAAGDRVLLESILRPLAGLRPSGSDKRSQGHLVIVGGSTDLPGAILMATLSALRSGVGLVSTFVPESLAAAFAARAPEAMWAGLPQTASGGLSLEGLPRILRGLEKASALAMGPGLGRDPESRALAEALARASGVPLVIDADALQPNIVAAGIAPRILTPHAGEFARIAGGADLRALATNLPAVIVLKGPITRVSDGGAVYHSLFGGPVLSRGGSGDLLSGLTGGLLAQTPHDPLLAACRGAVWHGSAADALARSQGQTAVHTIEWLDYLSPTLRACP